MSDVLSARTSRRNLVKAGAWATPVLVTAAAAPAASASATGCSFGVKIIDSAINVYDDIVWLKSRAQLTRGDCGPQDTYGKPLSVSFTLDKAAYTGKWVLWYYRWDPHPGVAGTYSYTVTYHFPLDPGDSCWLMLGAMRVAGADLAPATFTFSGNGVTPTDFTLTPT